MTNADRIRNMSDEELADFIIHNPFDCSDYCNEFSSGCARNCIHNLGVDFAIEWIQSEAKGE